MGKLDATEDEQNQSKIPMMEMSSTNPKSHNAKDNEDKFAAVKNVYKQVGTREFWLDRFPVTSWARQYNSEKLLGDVIAGLTTALTVIPQGIGYAPLAGLPLQYGLYASIMPGFVYCIFGTLKEPTIGPTAPCSVMSYQYAGPNPAKAATLGFVAGVIELVMGILNLGFLLQFVSGTVIAAFSSAVAIQVMTSQVKGLFGIKYPGRGFVTVWLGLFRNIKSTRVYDLIAGLVSLTILYALRKLKEFRVGEGSDPESTRAKVVKKIKFLLSISANCCVVLIGSTLAYCLIEAGQDNILVITGSVEGGLPPFQLPWMFKANPNFTAVGPDFSDPVDIMQDLGLGLIMLPLVSLLCHLAIAKHYAGSKGMKASQEMIALGTAQTLGSFVGSLPVTASFGRSAVNSNSGVRTQFGGVITATIIILTCIFLSPYLAYIPTSVLAAVIIFSVLFVVDYNLPYNLAKEKDPDLVPWAVTFLLGLFVSLESALIAGTLVHSFITVYLSTRLRLDGGGESEFTLVQPDRGLFYPSVDNLRAVLNELGDSKQPVVLDLSCVQQVDYSSAKTLKAALASLQKVGVEVHIVAPPGSWAHANLADAASGLGLHDSLQEAKQALPSAP